MMTDINMNLQESIRRILREEVSKDICNIMTVDTYEEGIKLLTDYLGTPEENPQQWNRIKKPLDMWKEITIQIRDEIKTGMTGDSEVDESDTWWSAIIGTLCR